MSAEVLREAAALMRERAEAAVLSPWQAVEGSSGSWWVEHPNTADIALDLHGENARHIASWHPAVALAVADWLTVTAWWLEDEWPDDPDAPMDWANSTGATAERVKAAFAVARAYLASP